MSRAPAGKLRPASSQPVSVSGDHRSQSGHPFPERGEGRAPPDLPTGTAWTHSGAARPPGAGPRQLLAEAGAVARR
jgi:hypothetical protein